MGNTDIERGDTFFVIVIDESVETYSERDLVDIHKLIVLK